MVPDNSTVNVLSTQITLSALSVALIQYLKNSEWATWFHKCSDTLNKAMSAMLSLATAVGIHMTWSHGSVPGSYMIAVSGLTLVGIGSGLFAVIKSLVFNELIYRGVVKSSQDTSIKVTSTAPAKVEIDKPASSASTTVVPGTKV